MTLRFGTDGVRAEAFTVLTTDYVAALGRAAAQVLGGGQWLIGRDTRESGAALIVVTHHLHEGLALATHAAGAPTQSSPQIQADGSGESHDEIKHTG